MQNTLTLPTRPVWLLPVAALGFAWNIFGAVQFAGTLSSTSESLMASGLTAEQAQVMLGYPAWMTVAFGIGVAGGAVGSVMLALRHGLTASVFALSLVAYVALWIGDAIHGVFAALGAPQVAILTFVVAVAAGLLFAAIKAIPRK